MSETENGNTADGRGDQELLGRVSEASLRMMAGVVPGDVVQHLQARLYAQPDEYPWQEVVDTVLEVEVPSGDLINRGVVAQRNWLLRGSGSGPAPRNGAARGTGRRAPSASVRGKTFLAALIVKGGFFIVYTLAVIALLILLRHKFPSFDIYRVLGWLGEVLPGVFGTS